MNQFKKAKQLRNETGQATERITDLKTAGVTQNTQNAETSIAAEKTVPQNTANTDSAIDTKTSEPENSTQTPVVNTTNPAPSKPEPSMPLPAPIETIVHNEPIIQPATEEVPIPVASYENMTATVVPAKVPEIIDHNTHNSSDLTLQTTNVPTVSEPTPPVYTDPVIYENTPRQSVPAQSFIEPQPAQEIATVKHTKNTKKSVPNIFAPKGEAKSMRKSLVLKPTSVKIAENYCEKNGGSFNELIQTLLDNFIDEYGL